MHEPSPLLQLPDGRFARWQLLSDLIAQWYRPLTVRSGYSRAEIETAQEKTGICLPVALTEWYALAGKRGAVWSQQDRFLPPECVFHEHDNLIFYVENQGVVSWGIPIDAAAEEDPPVVVHSVGREDEWLPQTDHVSKFALYMFSYNLMFANRNWWVYGHAQESLLGTIASTFPRLEFPDNWWTQSRLFGHWDLVIAADGADFVHVSALSCESLRTFTDLTTNENFDVQASWQDE